eukprot:TRINITY_DN164_c2_g1_i5.p1 TRINITY_DN164_c2_g1~~TRINITY_DN164_c2_g1_i5.p1  ORF type:complete len:554 (+),score=98.85 TRINITY_DN164_c2_g1_i5:154-1815(+)
MAGQRNNYGKRSHSQDYSDNGGSKRRNSGNERDQYTPGSDDTVYRYLCPGKKIGSIIGRGGEIVKQLRAESQSKIRIGESIPGCDERVITVFSTSRETNAFEDTGDFVSPARDALFRVHERIVSDETAVDEDNDGGDRQITVRLLVPSDQIGCIIGKGGQIIQNIRSETGAQVRILKNESLPPCAMSSDELLQISGEAAVVKKALYQISSRLHDNPSRSQHLLTSSNANMYQPGGQMVGSNAGAPYITPLMGSFGGYKGEVGGDWSSHSYYPPARSDSSAKEFSLRLVCQTGKIGGVIGKGGVIINQIRQESRALIKVDSSSAGDDCIISVSAKEFFEDPISPTIDAAVRLQPRCSEKTERESGEPSYTTRLLVPTSRIGCLIGKGGAIISEMRRLTRANIRIFSKEDLPKVASADDEMVQISGDIDVSRTALVQVATRLKANLFEKEGALSAFPSALPYPSMPVDVSDAPKYGSRDTKTHGRSFSSYSGGYGGSTDLPYSDNYGSYGGSQSGGGGGGGGSGYGTYGGYSSRRSTSTGLSGQNPVSHGKHHGY